MKRKRVAPKSNRPRAKAALTLPRNLRKYVCTNDEIIEKTRDVKVSFADVAVRARRGSNGKS